MPDRSIALGLFFRWLHETYGRAFRAERREGGVSYASDGEHSLAFCTAPLLTSDDAAWNGRREELEGLIGEGLPLRVALWAPAGADLPGDEPALSEFVALVRQSATKLGPKERSYVPLPATLLLRKTSESGGVVSVTGGLNPHWARFTERVRGSYDLDSTQLHRLPESDEHLEGLIDEIAARTEGMQVGGAERIETIDAWTIQQMPGDHGATIVGVPPSAAAEGGLTVRRNFRRILADAAPKLRESQASVRTLVLLGFYPRIEQEGATTAMRGYGPELYSGLDFVVLAADGLIKPLIQPPESLLPWAEKAQAGGV